MDEQLDRIESMIKEYIEKSNSNTNNMGRIEEQQHFYNKEWDRNWKQHEEFYKKLDILESENDRVAGGIKVLGALLVPIVIGLLISLFKSFFG